MMNSNYSHGGNIREVAKKYGFSPQQILDFSANVNPWASYFKVEDVLRSNLREIFWYPEPYCEKLTKKISEYLKVDKENILVGNGATQLIYLIARSFTPRRALIVIPTFSEYERALRGVKTELKFLTLKEADNFSIDIQKIIKAAWGVEIIFICNPNNPTGSFLFKKEILKLRQIAKEKRIILIIDESYIDFKYPEESLAREAVKDNHTLVLRSFTKFFAAAGLRLGYAVGKGDLIDKLRNLREPWMVNSLAQIAGIHLLKNSQYIEKIREAVDKERKFLFEKLFKIKGLKPYPPQANFILIKIKGELSSSDVQDALAKRGILVRDCSNFRGLTHKFIRVAVRSRKDNLKLIENLKELIS